MTYTQLRSIMPTTYAPTTGSKLTAQSIKLCTPFDQQMGPRVARVDIPWTAPPYNASSINRIVVVPVNLVALTQGSQASLDAIRFCKIDNTFNDVTVYARFDDTGDVVQCPPNSIVGIQVQSANQQITLFGTDFFTGRAPTTSFFFSNAPQQPFFIQDAGRFITDGSFTETLAFSGIAGAGVTNGVELGPALASRVFVVAAFARRSAAGALLSTVNTIGGIQLTTIINQSFVPAAGNQVNGYLGYAVIPPSLGTFASLSQNYNANITTLEYGIWTLTQVSSNAPFDDVVDQSLDPDGTITLPLASIPGSLSVYAAWSDKGYPTDTVLFQYGGAPDIQMSGFFVGDALAAQQSFYYTGLGRAAQALTLAKEAEIGLGATWI